MSSAFVICRRSPVLARRSAWVRPGKLHAARSVAAARFRRGSGSGSDHGGPLCSAAGHASRHPAGPCARGLRYAAPLTYPPVPVLDDRPAPGMMATGAASERTHDDVTLRKAVGFLNSATYDDLGFLRPARVR
jgi:hypothetical protein